MNDITLSDEAGYGRAFVTPELLPPGRDEYYLRNSTLDKPLDSYRPLRAAEIETLTRNGNTCADWTGILVRDPFAPDLIRSSDFAGLVRIGRLERVVLSHHDLETPAGITDSRIVSCDIGDLCAVHGCDYIARYQIGDSCILLNNNEIHATNHAKFGNGIVMEGEEESVRVWIDLMNEAGGRSVLPFDGMICADAWLWAKRRDDSALMERFKALTQGAFDARRGRYGRIGAGSVLKHNRIIKDALIGDCAYIKGANKLKNITINSSDAERTQIGEGVEMVNGIVGYGCRVFYGVKAIRFVLGNNSALKYGARLVHSVLGDNSTVSCCELLNNLIFPAHEQHHNTSFLIASVVQGQSNLAAGCTIGSNHNSRANDGEIQAARGFWPGLSTSLKHSCRFASYVLLSKGDYPAELDIPLPFCLVNENAAKDRIELIPAYWWMYNLYALLRNESKFAARDRRITKVQAVEFAPLAPDTAEEIFRARILLEEWAGTAVVLAEGGDPSDPGRDGLRERGRAFLSGPEDGKIAVHAYGVENSTRPVLVLKAGRAWKAYRRMLHWYAVREILAYLEARPDMTAEDAAEALDGPRERSWENLGGQIVPAWKVERLAERVRTGELKSWRDVHESYDEMAAEYPVDKARHAWASLRELEGWASIGSKELGKALDLLEEGSRYVEEQVYLSRAKDYSNPFRRATFRNPEELRAVCGSPEGNPFVRAVKEEAERLRGRIDTLRARIRK